MRNIEFYQASLKSEFMETYKLLGNVHEEELNFKAKPQNKSIGEILEYILSLYNNLNLVIKNANGSKSPQKITNQQNLNFCKCLYDTYNLTETNLNLMSNDKWFDEHINLHLDGQSFYSSSRSKIMWLFLIDITNERKKLLTNINLYREMSVQNLYLKLLS